MKTENYNIRNPNNEYIDITVDYSQKEAARPIFLFLHGFKAFKDWGFYPYLCRKVADAGFISIRFSFSLSAVVDTKRMIYDPDRFARNTTTDEINDANFIIESIINNSFGDFWANWNGDIYIAGHSKGAGISLLVANNFENIKKISLISAIAHLDRYSERHKQFWREKGFFEFGISATKQKLRMNYSYIDDIIKNSEKYSLIKAVNTLNKPLQILHGDKDVTVGIAEAYELAHNYVDKSRLIFDVINKAGHGFAARHPFETSNLLLDEMIYKLNTFLSSEI